MGTANVLNILGIRSAREQVRNTRDLIFRGGIFTARRILKAPALVVFDDYKTEFSDFQSRALSDGEVSEAVHRTTLAFQRLRDKTKTSNDAFRETLLGMLDGLQPKVLGAIGKDKISTALAASQVLDKCYSRLRDSDNANMRKVYREIQTLLIALLNEEVNTVGEIKDQLDALDQPVILVCRDIPEHAMAILSHPKVVAVVREKGGRTDHKSILLKDNRKLGIVGVGNICERVKSGDCVILNGLNRTVTVRPLARTERRIEKRIAHFAAVEEHLTDGRVQRVATLDGTEVRINLNIEDKREIGRMFREYAYHGIGVARTEFILRNDEDGYERTAAPEIAEQVEIYNGMIATLLDASEACDVLPEILFRTLDIGGDKSLPFLNLDDRARQSLERQGFGAFLDPRQFALYLLLNNQLEALLRSEGVKSIMFPSIFRLRDFGRAMERVDQFLGTHPRGIRRMRRQARFGIIVEHPAVIDDLKRAAMGLGKRERDAWRLGDLQFISIGTGDLLRYMFTIDRSSASQPSECDELHPKMIRAIGDTVNAANALEIDVSLCGDMANDPLALLVLLGLGIRSVSFAPDFVDIGRQLIRSVSIEDIQRMMISLQGLQDPMQIRRMVNAYVEIKTREGDWQGLKPIRELILDGND